MAPDRSVRSKIVAISGASGIVCGSRAAWRGTVDVLRHLHRHDVEVAMRVGVSVGLPLLAVFAIGRLDLAGYAAFGALTSLYGNGEIRHRRFETQIVAAVALVATIAVAAVFSAAHGPLWILSVLLVGTVLAAGTLGAAMGWVPRGEIFFVLPLLVLAQKPTAWTELSPALAAAAISASLSVLLGVLWRPREERSTLRLDELHHRAMQGFASLDRREHCVLILAAAAAVLSAWLLAIVLGVGDPFWASVTVASLMPALASVEIYRRMVHSVLGTLVGVGVAAVLFAWNPGHLELIAMIVLCQMAFLLFVARQYGVALVFLSPLAIGMSNLSRDLPWQPLLVDRLAETALGVAVAFVVILLSRGLLVKVARHPPSA
jgi:uncharacterized membrane protein YccC